MDEFDRRPSRLAALPLALIFLLEYWVWRRLVAFAAWIATLIPWERFRDAARRLMNRLPAAFSVLLFGIPLLVAEFGSFISVVLMAMGHVMTGVALYILMKIFGLLLVPIIFEITREKLLALPWFAWVYARFEKLHAMAHDFVAPYRAAALDWGRRVVASARRALAAFLYPSAARARAAKAETGTSSARAVGSNPAAPSH